MAKTLILLFCVFLSTITFASKVNTLSIKTGDWTGLLSLNETTTLPFKLTIQKLDKKKYKYTILNGNETIVLKSDRMIKDSLVLDFPSFDSYLVLKAGNKVLNGHWYNRNKKNYSIPCRITYGYKHRFESPQLYLSNFIPADFNGKWECDFEPGTPSVYKASGIFQAKGNYVEGTFLTETGDYRFLEGNIIRDNLYLSCFDGSHAFLFTGHLVDGNIYGKFYSGKHWQSDWTAVRNDKFELTSPDSLTYLVSKDKFSFSLKDLEGNDFNFPQEKFNNKVTIIQIMGTWCPNGMDETRYFKELYDKYHSSGLEVISVGYEVGDDFNQQSQKIITLKERYDLQFTFLVGGSANKGLAASQFSMLNNIISFPTAIIIDKSGNVKKIHTGFNGPGTGEYYTEYTQTTEELIRTLLSE